MTLNRDTLLHACALLVLLAGAAWIVQQTEWFEEQVPVAARGEGRDRHYALKQVMRRLGVELVTPGNLDRLPPRSATLVLASGQWTLFPEREHALRRWVEDGGHLVVSRLHMPAAWIPIGDGPTLRPAPAASPASAAQRCTDWREPDGVAPHFGRRQAFHVCGLAPGRWLTTHAPVRWSLASADGPQVLRVDIGHGRVTVARGFWTDNERLLQRDNALLFVALTEAGPGRPVWLVDEERRPALLSVIWTAAAPAVMLFAAALALLLWRAGVRFGPRARTAPPARRSVADQIRGTAAFVFQRDAAALHRVQLRALEDAGRRRLRDHDRLDRRARAEAIARATALDADALARAMDPTLTRPRRDLVATLALLETAVRRLATDH